MGSLFVQVSQGPVAQNLEIMGKKSNLFNVHKSQIHFSTMPLGKGGKNSFINSIIHSSNLIGLIRLPNFVIFSRKKVSSDLSEVAS